jgi:hypothetical protein
LVYGNKGRKEEESTAIVHSVRLFTCNFTLECKRLPYHYKNTISHSSSLVTNRHKWISLRSFWRSATHNLRNSVEPHKETYSPPRSRKQGKTVLMKQHTAVTKTILVFTKTKTKKYLVLAELWGWQWEQYKDMSYTSHTHIHTHTHTHTDTENCPLSFLLSLLSWKQDSDHVRLDAGTYTWFVLVTAILAQSSSVYS